MPTTTTTTALPGALAALAAPSQRRDLHPERGKALVAATLAPGPALRRAPALARLLPFWWA